MERASNTPASPKWRGAGSRVERHQSAADSSATIEMVSKPTRLSMTSHGVSAVIRSVPSVMTRDPVKRQAVPVRNPATASPNSAAGSRSTATVSGRNRTSAATE